MNLETEKVLSKIRKLLGLAESDNEHEAASAAAKAQELLFKYNLSTADLSTGEVPGEFVETEVYTAGRVTKWRMYLYNGISYIMECRLLVCTANGTLRHLGKNQTTLKLIGTEANIAAASNTIEYLISVVERLAVEHGRGKGRVWGASYRLGIAHRVVERLRELQRLREDTAAVGDGAGLYALVVRKRESLEEYTSKYKAHKESSIDIDYDGYDRGYQKGGEVNLNRQITKSGKFKVEYLDL